MRARCCYFANVGYIFLCLRLPDSLAVQEKNYLFIFFLFLKNKKELYERIKCSRHCWCPPFHKQFSHRQTGSFRFISHVLRTIVCARMCVCLSVCVLYTRRVICETSRWKALPTVCVWVCVCMQRQRHGADVTILQRSIPHRSLVDFFLSFSLFC